MVTTPGICRLPSAYPEMSLFPPAMKQWLRVVSKTVLLSSEPRITRTKMIEEQGQHNVWRKITATN